MNLEDFKFVRKPGTNDVEYVEWDGRADANKAGRTGEAEQACNAASISVRR